MCLYAYNIPVIFFSDRSHKIGVYPNESMLAVVLLLIELDDLIFGSRRIIYIVFITCKNRQSIFYRFKNCFFDEIVFFFCQILITQIA